MGILCSEGSVKGGSFHWLFQNASILPQQSLILSVCFIISFARSFFCWFFPHSSPILHGKGNSALPGMGHWASWVCAPRTRVRRCLNRRPARRTRAALELGVQHLGTDSRNVGLKNTNFSSDLTGTDKIDAADARNLRIGKEKRRVQRITSTFWSSLWICSWAWRRLSSRFSSPAGSPLSCGPSPSPLSSPPAALSRRTRWLTLTPRSSGLRGEGERARGEGLGESEDEDGGKTKD